MYQQVGDTLANINRVRFTASGRLGIWDSVNIPGKGEWRSKVDEFLQSNAHGIIESQVHDFEETDDPALAAVTAICDKIISRGNPTLVDPNWERALLSGPGSELLCWEEKSHDEIEFAANEFLWPEGICLQLLEAAHDLLDLPLSEVSSSSRRRLPAALQDLCSSEEETLYADLIGKLGPRTSGAVQRQALISELVSGDAATALSDNRVDFALQFSRMRWVIEVDGNQHLEPVQRGKDAFRDSTLRAGGWKVFRVSAKSVRSGRDLWLRTALAEAEDEERRSLEVGDLLGSVENALEESLTYRAAWHLLLRPLAVQRCMRGLVMLYRYGALDATGSQRILAVEEDIPVVADAIQMLQELWDLTSAIQPHLAVGPPEIHLDVIGEKGVRDAGQNVRYVDQPEGAYDAVISHSFLLGEGYRGSRLEQLGPELTYRALRIRRATGLSAERALLWAPGFNRRLEDSFLVPEEALTRLLQIVFRKKNFRQGQVASISRLLQGEHAIVLLPTGGGKSLIYQFVGMLQPGMTVVVDPIISLMDDQVRCLKELCIDRAEGISSQTEDIEQAMQDMVQGKLYYIFVSPERLQSDKFRNEIQKVTDHVPISLVALDEAHCLSEWGHDFRPAYLNLPLNLQRYCRDRNTGALPTLAALTGTASYAVLEDMQAELEIDSEDAIIRPESFDREELNFAVRKITARTRSQELDLIREELPLHWDLDSAEFDELNGEKTYSGLVFCPHIDGKKGIAEVAKGLGHKSYYGGRMPKNFATDWNPRQLDGKPPSSDSQLRELWKGHKRELQRRFSHNEVREMVATKAFGMGIDKSNIRYTIHFVMPASVEQFYQEAGRAGRDQEKAYCTILYIDAGSEVAIKEILDEPIHSKANDIREKMHRQGNQTDVLVPLYFLLSSFKSREEEQGDITELWRRYLLSNKGWGTKSVQISFRSETECRKKERCIYRLRILGIVKDYTVQYVELEPKQEGWFLVETGDWNVDKIRMNLSKYLAKYKFPEFVQQQLSRVCADNQVEAVEQAIEILVDFIYDSVVRKRKEAIRNMVQMCRDYESSDGFRASILAYLEESPFTEELNKWRRKSFGQLGLPKIRAVMRDLDESKNGDEMGRLRGLIGTTRRMLEADPENVALRYLSVCARAASPWEPERSVVGEVATLIVWARIEGLDMDWIRLAVLQDIVGRRPGVAGSVAHTMVTGEDGLPFARRLLRVGRKYGNSVRLAALGAISTNAVEAVTGISGFYHLKQSGGQDDTRGE